MAQELLGTASSIHVRDLVTALAEQDLALGIHVVNKAVDSGSDPRQFGMQIVEFLRQVMLAQTASAELIEASQEDRALCAQLAASISRTRLLKTLRTFNEAVNAYTGGWQPQLALELALIESLQSEDLPAEQVANPQPQPQARPQARSTREKDEKENPADGGDFERVPGSAPGEPPAYAVSKIIEGWMQVLTRVHQYNRNIPPLLEHSQVHGIEGNRLILGVTTEFFQQKDRFAGPGESDRTGNFRFARGQAAY